MNENPQGSRPRGKRAMRDPQAAVRAQLHHHAGQQHGGGGGRGDVAGGRPGVEGPHAGQNRKAGEDQREAPHLEAGGQAGVGQLNQSRRVAARCGVGRQQADEHHRRAREGIDDQLHGRVLAPRGAPDGDQEVLGHDGDFVKHKKQKKIEAEKNSVDSRRSARDKRRRTRWCAGRCSN